MGARNRARTLLSLALIGAVAGCSQGPGDPPDERTTEVSEGVTCTTFVRGGAGATYDAYIASDPADPSRAGQNYGAALALNTGVLGTATRQGLVQFDLSSIPPGAAVVSATLSLRTIQSLGGPTLTLHDVSVPWSEASVTWNSFAGGFDPSVRASLAMTQVPNGTTASVDLTSLVQAWVAGTSPNYGVLLDQSSGGRIAFGSSEASGLLNRPQLLVCYSPASCADGVQNGQEAGVDCGGSQCAPCGSCQNVVCSALDACHLAGTCNPATGQCSNPVAAYGTACDDGDACSQVDFCQAGVCLGTSPVVCQAQDACHAPGVCDPASGVCSNPVQACCSDGLQNQGETGVDCGGPCAPCPAGTPLDCEDLQATQPGLPSGTYSIDPDGAGPGAPFDVYCDLATDGGGWTKVMYFSGPRASSVQALTASALAQSLSGEGKLADATINQLMGGDHEMLAVLPANPAQWLLATWGSDWTFDDLRPSGQLGGFCQDMQNGGWLRRWDGSSDYATYRDAANLKSSYCWKFGWTAGADGGIDLENDGLGQSNASTLNVAQQPFAMFVRRTSQKSCAVDADCPASAAICAGGVCEAPLDCEDLHMVRPALGTGTYAIDPDGAGGAGPFAAYCDMTTDGGGWTKIMHFSAARPINTGAVTAPTLAQGLATTGKLADATINLLMGGNREMLAVLPAAPTSWLVATWGSNWLFDDARPSGQLGGYCQDMQGGGLLRRSDGTMEMADYRDNANLQSSYCWKFGWLTGGDGGIDLENDGLGQSNASTVNAAQQPFVMFVRRTAVVASGPYGSVSSNPGLSCADILASGAASGNGSYWVDVDGPGAASPIPVYCDMTTASGGWTKVIYFNTTRTLTTGGVSVGSLGQNLGATGKLPDAYINALMTGNHQMLAVLVSDTSKWLVATWGSNWLFDDLRHSGQAGGFCQTMQNGGALLRWDGSVSTATYSDNANVQSSYCWRFGFPNGGDGGIDLENDGSGQSNASTLGVGQQPFAMLVR